MILVFIFKFEPASENKFKKNYWARGFDYMLCSWKFCGFYKLTCFCFFQHVRSIDLWFFAWSVWPIHNMIKSDAVWYFGKKHVFSFGEGGGVKLVENEVSVFCRKSKSMCMYVYFFAKNNILVLKPTNTTLPGNIWFSLQRTTLKVAIFAGINFSS